jgi:hypothetical protein
MHKFADPFKKCNYYLYNILSNEKYKIDSDMDSLTHIIREVFSSKYSKNKIKYTDEQFFKNNSNINITLNT